MNTLHIEGGHPLGGEITASGNKNAALPLLAATLLTDQTVTLRNAPDIEDVRHMCSLLEDLGTSVDKSGETVVVTAANLAHTTPNVDLCRRMRASFALAGPILAREGHVELVAPGGDRIGRRPLDTHLKAFEALGATVTVTPEKYILTAPQGGLVGADIFLEEMSVLATENAVMAASRASGTTVLRNAASEPHVQDICHIVSAMGAHVEGIGTNTLIIEGQKDLKGTEHEVCPDYIEVGSFIALAALARGELLIKKARPGDHRITALAFGRLGVRFEARGDDIFVPKDQELTAQPGIHGAMPRIHDAPWPGFPADLTSIAIVLATGVKGTCMIHEWMYESRLYWVDRLISMGARIVVCDPHRAIIEGPARLYGRTLTSPDIRAGMSLLIAALVAEGNSTIHNAQQIDRGYQNIDARLRALGAKIHRTEE